MTVKAEPVEGVPGVTVRWLWAAKDAAPSFALRLFEVEPGATTPYHNHPYEHEIYVLSGQARLRGETQEYPLEPGDTALVLPGEQHQLVNAGPDTLRFLCGILLPRDSVGLTAQVSLYPLGKPSVAPTIDSAVEIWRTRGLDVEPGAMSTLIAGEDGVLWAGLRDAFAAAAAQGEAVMVVTVSNACPWPPQDHKS
jgi:quercetin dioxygenase-like cupin family protein